MTRSPLWRLSRRELLRTGVLAGAGVAFHRAALLAAEVPAGSTITRPIPSSGERLPVVGLGTNRYDASTPEQLQPLAEVLKRMLSQGGTVIDTAPAYGRSEEVLGTLLAQLGNRERFFLATKVTAKDEDAKDGKAMLEESRRRLRTGKIDLLQVHNLDGVEALLPVLLERKKAGTIRYVGITTSRTEAHERMAELMNRHALDFVQVDYSIGNRSAAEKILPLAEQRKIAVLVNMPLGGRRSENLFSKVGKSEPPSWAAEFDARSWAQFFLKYCIAHPAVTCVIPGTTKLEHLEDNLGAARGRLPDAAMRKRMEEYWDARS